ncbi:MAG: hypothetical protein QOF51_2688 [Chloroflexota bacterium]|jgi:hypothetical protein|nr:hypothetical protein [Chloroflexota bacterium]
MGTVQVIGAGVWVGSHYGWWLLALGLCAVVPACMLETIAFLINPAGRSSPLFALYTLLLIAFYGLLAIGFAATALGCAQLFEPRRGTGHPSGLMVYGELLDRVPELLLLGLLGGVVAIPLTIALPVGVYFWGRWSLAWWVALYEGLGPVASLKRSWELTEGAWWHACLVQLANAVLSMVVLMAVYFILSLVLTPIRNAGEARPLLAIDSFVSQLTTIAAFPIGAAITVMLYWDLRARHEAVDIGDGSGELTTS